jgi:hypothetical protein
MIIAQNQFRNQAVFNQLDRFVARRSAMTSYPCRRSSLATDLVTLGSSSMCSTLMAPCVGSSDTLRLPRIPITKLAGCLAGGARLVADRVASWLPLLCTHAAELPESALGNNEFVNRDRTRTSFIAIDIGEPRPPPNQAKSGKALRCPTDNARLTAHVQGSLMLQRMESN